MSDSDKMRQEFEAYLKEKQITWLGRFKAIARQFFWAGYAAGRKAEREEVESESFETARRCSVCGDWFSSSSQTLHPCPHCKTKPEGER